MNTAALEEHIRLAIQQARKAGQLDVLEVAREALRPTDYDELQSRLQATTAEGRGRPVGRSMGASPASPLPGAGHPRPSTAAASAQLRPPGRAAG